MLPILREISPPKSGALIPNLFLMNINIYITKDLSLYSCLFASSVSFAGS